MKKITVILLLTIVASCFNQNKKVQNQILSQTDSVNINLAQVVSIENNIIDFTGVSNIKLGMRIDSLLDSDTLNYTEYPSYGFYIYNADSSFQLLVDTDDRLFINKIEVFDTIFKLKSGIHVGSTLEEINKTYPDLKLYFNQHDYYEDFSINNDDKNISIILRTDSNTDSVLYGSYESDIFEAASEYDMNGKIQSIILLSKK